MKSRIRMNQKRGRRGWEDSTRRKKVEMTYHKKILPDFSAQ
jgi:hypothetical protein